VENILPLGRMERRRGPYQGKKRVATNKGVKQKSRPRPPWKMFCHFSCIFPVLHSYNLRMLLKGDGNENSTGAVSPAFFW
jgi:hypothetical protein